MVFAVRWVSMSRFPEDLLQFLRMQKIDQRQRVLMRELASECNERRLTVGEYADRYVRRTMRISKGLNISRMP